MARREEEAQPAKKAVVFVLIGALASLLVTIILLAVFALLVVNGSLSAGKPMLPVVISVFAGVFSGSFLCCSRQSGKKLLLGLTVGLFAFSFLFILGMFFSIPREGVFQVLAATLIAGMLGSLPSARKHRR